MRRKMRKEGWEGVENRGNEEENMGGVKGR